MEQSLVNKIKEGLSLEGLDPKSYSPLSLAYIGDAIYEIVIRTIVMSAGNMSVNKYHKKSSSMVKASAQKEVFEKIEPFLRRWQFTNAGEIQNQVLWRRMHP